MSRGTAIRTPELVSRAAAMRATGATLREIGEVFGVKVQTVSSWLHDPDGSRHAARKRSYCGRCVDCGGPTYGDGPGRTSERCAPCAADHQREENTIWTPETVLDAIHRWSREHDGAPPRVCDWLVRGDGYWPPASIVQRVFGTWNAALAAAGMSVMARGKQRSRNHWNRDTILAAIRRWTATHGEPPRCRDWSAAGPDHPHAASVQEYFGTWNEAIVAAGFRPRRAHFERRNGTAASSGGERA